MALTAPEKTFFTRMAHYVALGLDFEAAGEAVLADDQRIMAAALATDGCDFIEVNGEVHSLGSSAARQGEMIRSLMASAVWHSVRAEDHTARANRAWSG